MLSFVMLTWNSEKTILNSIVSILQSLSENGIDHYEIIVVDNGSTDGTRDILEKHVRDKRVKLIKLNKNYGTTYSRNVALKEVKNEYICIIDSDVEIKLWDIKKSLAFVKQHHCLLAPMLFYPDGRFQNSVKKFPTIVTKLLKLTKIFLRVQRFAELDFYKEMPFQAITCVETAISAFWLFPAAFLNEVGFLDEKIFYSPEDIDYCVRIRKVGYPIYYYPDIKAVHHTQQISHAKPFSKVSRSHFYGLVYFYFKHKYMFSPRKLRKNSPCFSEIPL